MVRYRIERDYVRDEVVAEFRFSMRDLALLDLDPIDLACIQEKHESAADYALSIEIIARRMQERAERVNKTHTNVNAASVSDS